MTNEFHSRSLTFVITVTFLNRSSMYFLMILSSERLKTMLVIEEERTLNEKTFYLHNDHKIYEKLSEQLR